MSKQSPRQYNWWEGVLALLIGMALAFALNHTVHAHDSWISKKGYRSPSAGPNAGIHCCGDNDCGFWDGREGESIELKPDGYHVDATFTLGSEFQGGKRSEFHLKQIIPEKQTHPFSEDGRFWACVNWGVYSYPNDKERQQMYGGNPVRCFFAPPPGA
jgi:hypothetical protein